MLSEEVLNSIFQAQIDNLLYVEKELETLLKKVEQIYTNKKESKSNDNSRSKSLFPKS